jgi:hypothetical protein
MEFQELIVVSGKLIGARIVERRGDRAGQRRAGILQKLIPRYD